MRHKATMLRSLRFSNALFAALTLAACASSGADRYSPARTQVVAAEVPASLRDCRRAPSWPALEVRARARQRHATQAEVAEFVALMSAAHKDCRSKLAAVDRLLRRVEVRAGNRS